MRHLRFGKKLSRDTNARKALLNNLVESLVINGQIVTTVVKAKFARPYVEKMVTIARRNNIYSNRRLGSKISPKALRKLVHEIGPGFIARNGGYTRIIKMENRGGDNAPMAKLEFLEWDKTKKIEIKKTKKNIKKVRKSSAPLKKQ